MFSFAQLLQCFCSTLHLHFPPSCCSLAPRDFELGALASTVESKTTRLCTVPPSLRSCPYALQTASRCLQVFTDLPQYVFEVGGQSASANFGRSLRASSAKCYRVCMSQQKLRNRLKASNLCRLILHINILHLLYNILLT